MNNKMQECILAHNGQLCYAIASNTSKENRCQIKTIAPADEPAPKAGEQE